MTEPSVPLMPDDESQAPLRIVRPAKPVSPPYGYTAIMAGMLLLFLLKVARISYNPLMLNLVLAVSVVSYAVLVFLRPRLPLYLLSVAAAELGLLYSLPAHLIYRLHPGNVPGFALLLMGLTLAAVTGLFTSYALDIDEYPGYLLPINFLLLFVLVGGYMAILHR